MLDHIKVQTTFAVPLAVLAIIFGDLFVGKKEFDYRPPKPLNSIFHGRTGGTGSNLITFLTHRHGSLPLVSVLSDNHSLHAAHLPLVWPLSLSERCFTR